MTLHQPNQDEIQIVRFFCRHLVALCIAYSFDSDPPRTARRFRANCGMLANIEGQNYWLTAGHILRGLKENLENPCISIHEAVLADTFGNATVSDLPIPFDLRNAKMFFIDDDALGLDFGLVPLSTYYVRLLSKNGVVALSEENWTHQKNVDFDSYMLLGLPDELATERIQNGISSVYPIMFPLFPVDTRANFKTTAFPRFIAELPKTRPIKSIVGMSGGPIFGIHHGEQMRYWVVALQSSWDPQKGIIFGCPLPTAMGIISDSLRERVAS